MALLGPSLYGNHKHLFWEWSLLEHLTHSNKWEQQAVLVPGQERGFVGVSRHCDNVSFSSNIMYLVETEIVLSSLRVLLK